MLLAHSKDQQEASTAVLVDAPAGHINMPMSLKYQVLIRCIKNIRQNEKFTDSRSFTG